jgi:aladin
MAPVRPGSGSHLGTATRGSGARWSPVDYLRSKDDNPVTSISWSPNGRLLAAASRYGSAITIWDVALGTLHELG